MTVPASDTAPTLRNQQPVPQKNCGLCTEAHMTHNPLPAEGGVMERISDFLGSTRGIYALAATELLYIVVFGLILQVDVYPFGFLTLVLSLIALTFTQIVMIVQNRQGAIIELKAQQERANVALDLALDTKSDTRLALIMAHLGIQEA
jgi:uncharacterized membrane protein